MEDGVISGRGQTVLLNVEGALRPGLRPVLILLLRTVVRIVWEGTLRVGIVILKHVLVSVDICYLDTLHTAHVAFQFTRYFCHYK